MSQNEAIWATVHVLCGYSDTGFHCLFYRGPQSWYFFGYYFISSSMKNDGHTLVCTKGIYSCGVNCSTLLQRCALSKFNHETSIILPMSMLAVDVVVSTDILIQT